jgi:phage/plasmid-like protein (TIGR03299 family)
MSHDLERHDDAAFNARPGWHGIGTVLPEGELSVASVKEAAPGFLFDVESRPLFVGAESIEWSDDGGAVVNRPTDVEVPGHSVQVASDNGDVLGITGDGYHAFSNQRLLDLVSEVSAFGDGTTLESVLALKGRRLAVVLAHVGGFTLPGDDRSESYMLWSTSHDGTSALRVLPTSIRVVCSNTLSMALARGSRAGFAVRHTVGMEASIREGVAAMRNAQSEAERFEEGARAMAGRDMTESELRDFFLGVYERANGKIPANPETRGENVKRNRAVSTVSRWFELLDSDRQRLDGRTTVWSALNAVTEHADHERNVRTRAGQTVSDARTFSRLLGTAADMKSQALDRALALVAS